MFAGGCAVTHAAMLSGKYGQIIANDITDAPQLFLDALNGKYKDESRWVSREDFFRYKDSDPYIRLCWSFGNNGMDYLYSREKEPLKKAVHYARVYGDDTLLREMGYPATVLEHSLRLHRLQGLDSSLRVKGLFDTARAELLKILNLDYREVRIKGEAVIYCDPPYKGPKGYGMKFDHEAFYDWCCAQSVPVYISEYAMPGDRFECVAEIPLNSTICTTSVKRVVERVFIPRGQCR